ncbi:Maf-like protein [Neorhizobium lilium]|uniref:7-methyl-GTP pyrophosphatase n=1 Tax=Neorhizobium lilium TaxID=2503024 RepID=A0A444LAI3_9HYPH|nr:Maf-like protein [Neorhizobium lilium]RWX74574.1 Maf-like protein [Neorhizobium lilium]
MKQPLVLASSSPFRRMLMENAGLVFESFPAGVDERKIEQSLDGAMPDEVALALAQAKAVDVSAGKPGALVIGSDQTMSLSDRVFHKPRSLEEARENLLALSDATHRLNSAIVFAVDGGIIWRHISHADLTVRRLNAEFVDRYLARVGEKVFGSVGAYQLEGEGIQLFSRIEGDYFTILGLPMLPLLEKLRELGAIDA